MKRVLVWHQGALGDLMLSLPAVHAIKEHVAHGTLHLVCREDMSEIILENDLADNTTSNEKGMFGCLFVGPENHTPDLGTFLDGFDVSFIFMRHRNNVFLDNIGRYVQQCHHILTFPQDGVRKHVSRYQLEQLAELGIRYSNIVPLLHGGSKTPSPAGLPVVAVHPGSGGMRKRWPLWKYLMLMEELHRQDDIFFVVILGPAESDGDYETLKAFISAKGMRADVKKNMPVSLVVQALREASLYIGNDSGITHLAAALGIPAVAIFGPTDHNVWKPLGNRTTIARHSYPCAPCGEETYRGCGKAECLETLSVETVLTKCLRTLRVL